MNVILFILGILLLLIAFTDLLRTTIKNEGAGFVSSRIASGVWRLLLFLSSGKGEKRLLGNAGLLIIISLMAFWIGTVWLGCSLIFCLQEDSVVTGSLSSTTFGQKFYFSGYVLSTMGNGDFMANGTAWKILSAFISFLGLILLTLTISYIIPVLSAVVEKRKLSAFIYFIGNTPEAILNNGWDGKSFDKLNSHVRSLSDTLLLHKERHLLYPILHYFHSTERKYAAPVTLAILDEALTILLNHPALKGTYNQLDLKILRSTMTEYLRTLDSAFVHGEVEAPPVPGINGLSMASEDSSLKTAFQDLSRRRKTLKALVKSDGWKWDELYIPSEENSFDSPNKQNGHKVNSSS